MPPSLRITEPWWLRCHYLWQRLTGRPVELGRRGENLAACYLRRIGWKILARNQLCFPGELDLIAEENATLVIIEVRTSSTRALPEKSFHLTKQRHLLSAARRWRRRRGLHAAIRLDLICIAWGDPPQLRHHRGVLGWRH